MKKIFLNVNDTFSLEMLDDSTRDSIDKTNRLYNDLTYTFALNLAGITDVKVSVNDEPADTNFFNGKIYCRRIFFDCYGFAQIQLEISFADGSKLNFYSEYLPVFVRDKNLTAAVHAMVRYIYDNCANYLFDGDLKSRIFLDDRLRLAEKIAAAYDKNSAYFRANCRCKIDKIPALDNFEKLQTVTPAALQFIAAHPENLQQTKSTAGVRIGNRVFQPQKVLTLQNNISRDIYENRAIVSFLQKMLDDLASLHDDYARRFSHEKISDGEYENSAQYLFYWAELALDKISNLRQKFKRLLKIYCDALQLQPSNFAAPQPTQIFLSVPRYNQIFLLIRQWLKLSADLNFFREDFMLAIAKNWDLYEKYLLLKFLAYLTESRGFRLYKKFCIRYPQAYQQTQIANEFIFTKGKIRATIYYRPVIYSDYQKGFEGPKLYRNNSNFGGGSYYVPDFVFKLDDGENPAQIIIADAKFSTADNVKNFHLQDFILKYIFSISPTNQNENISGYRLVYGKCNASDTAQTAYDKQLTTRKISPSFELVPLMENISNQNLNLHEILTL